MSESTWTVAKVISWATNDFQSKGFDSPRLEAEVLLGHVLGLSRIELYTGFDRPLNSRELEAYRVAIKRRRGGEPSAYITGEKEFWSLTFFVDKRVLIPRPDTETLVATTLEHVKKGPLLDLCAGSGCVAIALATELKDAMVDATDISEGALEIAARNVAAHSLGDRVHLYEGDLFEACPKGARYAAIVSNPPYVTEAQYDTLSAEVKAEPKDALVAGADGLDAVRKILAGAREHLLPGGFLALEIDPAQAEIVAGELGVQYLGLQGRIQKDMAGRRRVVFFTLKRD